MLLVFYPIKFGLYFSLNSTHFIITVNVFIEILKNLAL